MNIFKRLFKIGKAEIHSVIDNFEDPINMTEQGIREMKEQLSKSIESLAQLKALAIRKKNEVQTEEDSAKDYYNKAVTIIQKAENNEIDTAEADRMAKEALKKQSIAHENSQKLDNEYQKLHNESEKMQGNINTLKSGISKWENELKTLKARVQVSEATKDINKKMTFIESGSTVSMLEKLKERAEHQEAMAESYSTISNVSKTVDEKIDSFVNNADKHAEDALKRIKETLKKE